jgi:hypothetical protein
MAEKKKLVKKEEVAAQSISAEDQATVDRLKRFAKRYGSSEWISNRKKR